MWLESAPKSFLKNKDKEITSEEWDTTDELAYWRKANCVHRWFLSNCKPLGRGSEEFRRVTKSDLVRFKSIIKNVLKYAFAIHHKENDDNIDSKFDMPVYELNNIGFKRINKNKIGVNLKAKHIDPTAFDLELSDEGIDIAESLLPTEDGFFFGSTKYDSGYVSDLIDTYNIINNILDSDVFKYNIVFYYPWW